MLNKPLKAEDINSLINTALEEDIQSGDITTRNIISAGQICEAELIAKETLVLAGLEILKILFLKLDPETVFLTESFRDGDRIEKGSAIIKFRCRTVSALEGERSG
jgi:nicotinate-nucleotide pyrophosphorylase (carboxylating)